LEEARVVLTDKPRLVGTDRPNVHLFEVLEGVRVGDHIIPASVIQPDLHRRVNQDACYREFLGKSPIIPWHPPL